MKQVGLSTAVHLLRSHASGLFLITFAILPVASLQHFHNKFVDNILIIMENI